MSNQRDNKPAGWPRQGYGWLSICLLLTNLFAIPALYFLLSERLERQNSESLATQRALADAVKEMRQEVASAVESGQKRLETKLDSFPNVVSQQTAVIHRALGQVIPIVLPESTDKRFQELEARIADEKAWPKTSSEADAVAAQLRDLVRQIPPWAEEDLLPRLNALRWGVSGIGLVARSYVVTDDELADYLDDLATAIEAKPENASELVANHLTATQEKFTAKFNSFRRDRTLAEAEKLRNEGGGASDFSDVLERLSEWATLPEFKARIEKLMVDLRGRALSDAVREIAASVDQTLERLPSEKGGMVRQITLGKLLDRIVSQRQLLLESPDAGNPLLDNLTELSVKIEKRIEEEGRTQAAGQETKLARYQGLALERIRKFNDEMDAAEGLRVPSGVVDKNDYSRIQKAMVDWLVPISAGLLSPATSRLYNEAFERGWKRLENKKDYQTEVAKQEAIIEKLKP